MPLLSCAVHAGFPSPADDYAEEGVDLHELLVRNRAATFVVRVAGDSMRDEGLRDGDLAVVDRSLEPRDGDVVVVDVDGERSFKVWRRSPAGPRLSYANADMEPYRQDPGSEVEVWGVVSAGISPRRRGEPGPRGGGGRRGRAAARP